MAADRLLALDLGTTSVRALVVLRDATVLGRAREPLAISFPAPGRVEQDPEAMWQASVRVMRAALAAAGVHATELAALGLVCQRGTSLAWDARTGAPLSPAIGWQDRRSDARVAELNRQGIPINTLASATKLEWLVRACEPVRRAAAAGRLRIGTLDAWLGLRLSGGTACVTDPGQAGATALYAAEPGRWNARFAALFGVDVAWLPEIAPTSGVVAETPRELLGAVVPLAARAGDQQAAAFAQGAVEPGRAKLTLGTSAMFDVCTGASVHPGVRGYYPLPLFTLADGTREFCLEGTVITAAAAIDWLVDLGLLASASELDRVAGAVSDAGGVAFVPALQGLGSPWMDGDARGLLGGLTLGTTRAQVVRAVLEGVAHRCVDVIEGVRGAVPGAGGGEDEVLRVDGGLARSDLLLQRIADLSGRVVERAAETETTALGAAMLAGLAVGLYAGAPEAATRTRVGRRYDARSDPAARTGARSAWSRVVERSLGSSTNSRSEGSVS